MATNYQGPTPQSIEEMIDFHLAHLDKTDLDGRLKALHLLVLNRIEQHLAKLAADLEESPDLARLADSLDRIQRNGLAVEDVYRKG